MPINAVITYRDNGTRRPCGQTVGADGRGDYAVLFDTETPEKADETAREYIKKLNQYEYQGRITNIVLVVAYEGFCGNAFHIVKT